MKKQTIAKRLLLLAFAIFLTGCSTINDNTQDKLVVGSFNLRVPVDKNPNDLKTRAPRIINTIREAQYDIFGTQETVEGHTEYITKNLNYKDTGHGRNKDKTGESTRIFYNPERLKLISSETFWLTETPDCYSMDYGTTFPRIATIALFQDKRTGKKFLFVNTHLQHKRMYETQKKQLNVVFERLKKYDSALPVILTGDFNSTPENPAPQLAAEKLCDARIITKTAPTGPMNETFHGYIRNNPKITIRKRIDYIFVSKGITVQKFATIDNFDSNGLASSDHYPVKAEIVLP